MRFKKSKLLTEYIKFLREQQCLCESTIRICQKNVEPFLNYLGKIAKPSKISQLSTKTIHDYIITTVQPLRRANKKHVTSSIRSFLKFAHIQGYLKRDLIEAVPIITSRKLENLPQSAAWEDIQKLLTIPDRKIQAIVENHAKEVFEFIENDKDKLKGGNAIQLIAEVDGSMVPIVETTLPKEGKQDKRRCRSLKWKEARLCFVREVNQVTPIFYATMGDVERVGQLLYRAALRVGLGARTKIHGVGDGAKWIADQMKRVFCKNVKYLIDFYHVSEYLAAAAEYGWTSEKGKWREENQNLLKESKYEEVLQRISLRLPVDWKEKKEENVEDTPVEKCYRYLDNRKDRLDYKDAIEKGLPIGSGEIESSHRYVIQKRLKIAGAWWRSNTAEWMLNLRVLRVNNDWDAYWEYRKNAA